MGNQTSLFEKMFHMKQMMSSNRAFMFHMKQSILKLNFSCAILITSGFKLMGPFSRGLVRGDIPLASLLFL